MESKAIPLNLSEATVMAIMPELEARLQTLKAQKRNIDEEISNLTIITAKINGKAKVITTTSKEGRKPAKKSAYKSVKKRPQRVGMIKSINNYLATQETPQSTRQIADSIKGEYGVKRKGFTDFHSSVSSLMAQYIAKASKDGIQFERITEEGTFYYTNKK